MPFKSKAQSRLMHGVASGSIPPKKGGPTKAAAKSFVAHSQGQKVSKLPERKAKK